MKRQFKTFVVTAASIAVSVAGTIPAQACGGRSSSRARVSVSRSHYPVVRQPVYNAYPQPVCVQPQVAPLQPTFAQPLQPISPAPAPGSQPGSFSNPALANRQLQPAGQLPTANRQAQPAAQLQRTSQTQATGQVQPTSQVQATPQAATPSTSTAGNAESSALQMLVSISQSQTSATPAASQIPQFTAAASQPAESHVGTWKVSLPGNQAVELTLNNDSSFIWTASKDGKSNSFQGQFRLEGNRLTLVRSNDLQQMTGSWSGADNQFTFKLDGATTGGLAFQRS